MDTDQTPERLYNSEIEPIFQNTRTVSSLGRLSTHPTGFFKRQGIENCIWLVIPPPTPTFFLGGGGQKNQKWRWERKEKGKEGNITILAGFCHGY